MNNYRVPELTLKIGRYSNGHGSKYLNELHAETGGITSNDDYYRNYVCAALSDTKCDIATTYGE